MLSIDCCWVRGGVGRQLLRYWYWSEFLPWLLRELPCVCNHPVTEVFICESLLWLLVAITSINLDKFCFIGCPAWNHRWSCRCYLRFAIQELLLRHFCNLLSSYFCWRTCVRSTFQENQKRGQGSLKEEPHEPISLTNAMPLQQEYCFLMKDFWTSDSCTKQ